MGSSGSPVTASTAATNSACVVSPDRDAAAVAAAASRPLLPLASPVAFPRAAAAATVVVRLRFRAAVVEAAGAAAALERAAAGTKANPANGFDPEAILGLRCLWSCMGKEWVVWNQLRWQTQISILHPRLALPTLLLAPSTECRGLLQRRSVCSMQRQGQGPWRRCSARPPLVAAKMGWWGARRVSWGRVLWMGLLRVRRARHDGFKNRTHPHWEGAWLAAGASDRSRLRYNPLLLSTPGCDCGLVRSRSELQEMGRRRLRLRQ